MNEKNFLLNGFKDFQLDFHFKAQLSLECRPFFIALKWASGALKKRHKHMHPES